jgi:mRNA interferase RelE/StbE
LIWRVEFDERAARELRGLDKQAQRAILRYLRERIATDQNPRRFGKPLSRELTGLWRYRIRDYRVVCNIEDGQLLVLVVRVGHRRGVYESL